MKSLGNEANFIKAINKFPVSDRKAAHPGLFVLHNAVGRILINATKGIEANHTVKRPICDDFIDPII